MYMVVVFGPRQGLGCGMAGSRPFPAALHRNLAPRFALAVVQSLVVVAIVVVADAS